MALTKEEKLEIYMFLSSYSKEHINENITVNMLRELTHTNYSAISYIAQMDKINNYRCINSDDKMENRVWNIKTLTNFDRWVKNRNVLEFFNVDNELVFSYDFNNREESNNNKKNIVTDNGCTLSNIIFTYISSTPEWIYSYPDLIEVSTFSRSNWISEECPKGYIKWCRDNNEKISYYSISKYEEVLKYEGTTDLEISKLMYHYLENPNSVSNSYDMEIIKEINRNNEMLDKVKAIFIKQALKIKETIEHESLMAYYRSCGSNDRLAYEISCKTLCAYICGCILFGYDKPEMKNILKNLTIIYTLWEERREEILNRGLDNNDSRLAYENDDIIVIVPKTDKEFKFEGDSQRNCVNRLYKPRVAKNITNVVFIRKKSNPKESYITCEVNKELKIIQYLARNNRSVSDSVGKAFRKEYADYLATLK